MHFILSRWRRVCCVPHIVTFEVCFLCVLVGCCVLVLYLTDQDDDAQLVPLLSIYICIFRIYCNLVRLFIVIPNLYWPVYDKIFFEIII